MLFQKAMHPTEADAEKGACDPFESSFGEDETVYADLRRASVYFPKFFCEEVLNSRDC